jgi:hypothetical protein
MALDAGTMIKKYHVALFVNSGTPTVPVWKRIQKSTDNTITMNAETKTFDYIVDESPTDEVDRYKPSLSQPITMYKGNEDYEFFFDKFFDQAVGDDAHAEILIVFYGADVASAYKAWKSSCVLILDNMNPVESTITANINFNGTTDKGTAVVTAGVPVFTSTAVTEFNLTVNVKLVATNVEGATVDIGGVKKLTDSSGNAVFTVIDGETYIVGAYDATHEKSDVFEADSGTTTINLVIE